MSSGAYASNSPEAILLRAVQGHNGRLSTTCGLVRAGATTAKEPGIQSAYENTIAMMMAYMNGADVTFGTGLLDGSRILCLENMVVDDEIIGMVKRIMRGIEVTDETIAKELIIKMGFNGKLPVRPAHAQARARAVDGASRRDRHVRELGRRRQAEHRSESAGEGPRDPCGACCRVPCRPGPGVRRDHRGSGQVNTPPSADPHVWAGPAPSSRFPRETPGRPGVSARRPVSRSAAKIGDVRATRRKALETPVDTRERSEKL